jgi:hypothetical protein
MGVGMKASEAYRTLRKAKKIRTYTKLVKQAIDEDTRSGALAKLSIRGLLDVAGKAMGRSLTSHPYFQYHKVHLEALAQALNASSNHDKALEALNGAIRSADGAKSLTKELDDYTSRRKALKLGYFLVAGSLETLREVGAPSTANILHETGQTAGSLRTYADESIYEWRARWCELYIDSVQLFAMAQVELRATEAAMHKFDEKMKALKKGGNIGRVAAYGVEQQRQWEQYDRMTKPGTGNAKAVEDPVGWAKNQVTTIETAADLLGGCCEIAMSDDAYRPEIVSARLVRLETQH